MFELENSLLLLEYELFERIKPSIANNPSAINALWWSTLITLIVLMSFGLISAFKENFKLTALFVALMLTAIGLSNYNPYVIMNPVTNVTNTAVLLIGLTYTVYITSEDNDAGELR